MNHLESNTKVLKDFHRSLLSFIDELIGMIPDCGELVAIKIFVKDRIPVTEIMKYFVDVLLEMEPLIKERSDRIILENRIFYQIDQKGQIKEMWANFDQEDKETLWKWIDHFLALTKKYVNT